MNILQEYISEKNSNPNFLDKVAKEFSFEIINYINEEFIDSKISDSSTKKRLKDNISKLIKREYNTLSVPYFYILENINLCVEVEMSERQIKEDNSQKFGDVKFTQILENGMQKSEPIRRFDISEKVFSQKLVNFVEKYTLDYDVDIDTIKIEFN
jgi:hypothetical protein